MTQRGRFALRQKLTQNEATPLRQPLCVNGTILAYEKIFTFTFGLERNRIGSNLTGILYG